MNRTGRRLAGFLAVGLLVLMILKALAPSGARGLVAGRLAPCPSSPNCVGSDPASGTASVEPWHPVGTPREALAAIRGWLDREPGIRVGSATDTYLHAVATTPILRFKDDLELAVDDAAGVLHVRSASRVGYSDLGTNRRRVESLRLRLIDGGILRPGGS